MLERYHHALIQFVRLLLATRGNIVRFFVVPTPPPRHLSLHQRLKARRARLDSEYQHYPRFIRKMRLSLWHFWAIFTSHKERTIACVEAMVVLVILFTSIFVFVGNMTYLNSMFLCLTTLGTLGVLPPPNIAAATVAACFIAPLSVGLVTSACIAISDVLTVLTIDRIFVKREIEHSLTHLQRRVIRACLLLTTYEREALIDNLSRLVDDETVEAMVPGMVIPSKHLSKVISVPEAMNLADSSTIRAEDLLNAVETIHPDTPSTTLARSVVDTASNPSPPSTTPSLALPTPMVALSPTPSSSPTPAKAARPADRSPPQYRDVELGTLPHAPPHVPDSESAAARRQILLLQPENIRWKLLKFLRTKYVSE